MSDIIIGEPCGCPVGACCDRVIRKDSGVRCKKSLGFKPITSLDRDILKLIATGIGNKQMADKLNLKKNTLETHRVRLYRKMNAKNAPHAVHIAYQNGILKATS